MLWTFEHQSVFVDAKRKERKRERKKKDKERKILKETYNEWESNDIQRKKKKHWKDTRKINK